MTARAVLLALACCCCFLGCQSAKPHAEITVEHNDHGPASYRDSVSSTWRTPRDPQWIATPPPKLKPVEFIPLRPVQVLNGAFPDYEERMVAKIQRRWIELLENRNAAGEQRGQATLVFQMHADGTVWNVAVASNSVSMPLAKLAGSAINDVAPFPKWNETMRQKFRTGVWDIAAKFNY